MASKELDIKIRTSFDGKGASAAGREIDSIGKKAARSGGEAAAGFGNARQGIESVSKSVSFLNKIATGFGLIGLVSAVNSAVTLYKTVRDAVEEARKKQQELAEGLAAIKEELAAGFTARTLDDITDALKRANDELARSDARRKAEADARRAAEDAVAGLEEQQELARIDPSDPLAAQKAGEVRARYASAKGTAAAERRLEDAAEKSRGLDAKRTGLLDEASAEDLRASMLRKDAERERGKAEAEKRKGDTPVSPPWWKVWASPAPDPDAQHRAAMNAKGFTQRAMELESESAKASSAASSRRAEASHVLDLLGLMESERGAAFQGLRQAREEGSSGRRAAASATESARISYINGGLRDSVNARLDSGISALEKSPVAQASPIGRALQASAERFKEKVNGMDMEAFLKTVNEITAALDRFEQRIANAKTAAAQTTSRLARQRDAD